jgi:nicotinate-nucleotide--dimethylbenzimidazole phosphoribosyltransferase
LYSLLLGIPPEDTVGPGTGSSGALLARKKKIVVESVALHRSAWDHTPFDALRRVGGYEIAGITGLIFGCSSRGIPVVVDGFIASSAALVAMRMEPNVKEYLFFSHESAEPFHASFLAHEHIRPIVSLDMRLGEGTGAVIAMQIIAQSMACYSGMATFSNAGVSNKDA